MRNAIRAGDAIADIGGEIEGSGGIGAGAEPELGLAGDHGPIALHASFDLEDAGASRRGGEEILLAIHDHLHRFAGLAGQQHRRGLQDERIFAAESATDLGADEANAAVRRLQGFGEGVADGELPLGGGPHMDFAVGIDLGDGDMGLDVPLMGHGDLIAPLKDLVCFLEARSTSPTLSSALLTTLPLRARLAGAR